MRVPTQRRLSLDNESMTPMIDVVFLLLVFFVCASIGQKPESLLPAELASGSTETDVEVPAEDPEALPESEVRIRLTRTATADLEIELNQQPVSGAAELGSRLKTLAKLDARLHVILDIGDDVSVQQFIAIYDRCQALGFHPISFALPANSRSPAVANPN